MHGFDLANLITSGSLPYWDIPRHPILGYSNIKICSGYLFGISKISFGYVRISFGILSRYSQDIHWSPAFIPRSLSTYPEISIYLSWDILLDFHRPILRSPPTYSEFSIFLFWDILPCILLNVLSGFDSTFEWSCLAAACSSCVAFTQATVFYICDSRSGAHLARRPRCSAGWALRWGRRAGSAPAAGPPGW